MRKNEKHGNYRQNKIKNRKIQQKHHRNNEHH